MKTVDWQKLKEIFNAAIELPFDNRADFLAEFDANLRGRLEKLLVVSETTVLKQEAESY